MLPGANSAALNALKEATLPAHGVAPRASPALSHGRLMPVHLVWSTPMLVLVAPCPSGSYNRPPPTTSANNKQPRNDDDDDDANGDGAFMPNQSNKSLPSQTTTTTRLTHIYNTRI